MIKRVFVLGTGLEPVRPLQSLDFKSSVSTNFTTQAEWFFDGFNFLKKLIKCEPPKHYFLTDSI